MASDYEIAMEIANNNDNCSTGSAPASLLKKRPNWTELEKKILVEEVHAMEGVLFGKFKGGFGGKAAKEKAWADVAEAVNGGSGSGNSRTGVEAQKQYSNLKQRAKGKLSEMKRPKTGGGPKPPSPSPAEKSILDNLEGRPSLEGISGGIDTADLLPTQPSTSSDMPEKKKDVRDSGKSSKRRMTIQDLEERNLCLENDKLQEEIKKIKDERELIQSQKSYYDLKFQILVNSNPEVVAQMLKSNEI
ncbi:myb/SANT-like DNA-binding domain-containing protein 4 [Saccostrea echinata]|uniref:myb/SANT-like DNA-binding domain-containing protein 4 n=2 Tax=Saccostrea echinata TaxID=191078 RepID=UPI002A7EBFE5|nr:myb/SANT-like DNA-binding domain-containing protein 4 [Saccostrea echinata]